MFQRAQSLSHLLRDAIGRHAAAGRTALVGPRWSMSYATLGVDIDRWANALHGIGRGEPVGVLGSRHADDITLFFGIMQGVVVHAFWSHGWAARLRSLVCGRPGCAAYSSTGTPTRWLTTSGTPA